MTLTKEQIDGLKAEHEAITEASKSVLSELYNRISPAIEEIVQLRKHTSWNFNIDEAPKDGSFVAIDLSYHSDDKGKWIEWPQIAQYSAQKEAWVTCWRTHKDYEIRAWHPTIAPLPKEELKND